MTILLPGKVFFNGKIEKEIAYIYLNHLNVNSQT